MESTNTYTEQVRAAKPEKHKSKWVPADTPSLIKFIGLTFIMGVLKKARIKDYWTTTPELATPFFGHVMKRDRFVVLMRYLNFGRQTPAATPMTSRQTRSRQTGVDQAPPVSSKSRSCGSLNIFTPSPDLFTTPNKTYVWTSRWWSTRDTRTTWHICQQNHADGG